MISRSAAVDGECVYNCQQDTAQRRHHISQNKSQRNFQSKMYSKSEEHISEPPSPNWWCLLRLPSDQTAMAASWHATSPRNSEISPGLISLSVRIYKRLCSFYDVSASIRGLSAHSTIISRGRFITLLHVHFLILKKNITTGFLSSDTLHIFFAFKICTLRWNKTLIYTEGVS